MKIYQDDDEGLLTHVSSIENHRLLNWNWRSQVHSTPWDPTATPSYQKLHTYTLFRVCYILYRVCYTLYRVWYLTGIFTTDTSHCTVNTFHIHYTIHTFSNARGTENSRTQVVQWSKLLTRRCFGIYVQFVYLIHDYILVFTWYSKAKHYCTTFPYLWGVLGSRGTEHSLYLYLYLYL